MNVKSVQRIAMIVNAVILVLVFGLMGFFRLCDVTIMTWFSIPTVLVYITGFFLIKWDKMDIYVWIVYFWLTLYMCLGTICLGYGFGFHLYCFSMIPIIYVTEYLAYKLHRRSLRAKNISFVIAAVYLITTGFTAYFGPVYNIRHNVSAFFRIFNAICVFGFLIYYAGYLIRTVIKSEEKLTEMAHNDRLTGLYNRHYMLDCLEKETENIKEGFIAISDIDDFKKINDRYGHNAGDAVLKVVSKRMRESCSDCLVARWGGEEFLFFSKKSADDGRKMMEILRQLIAADPIVFNDYSIPVTITIGIAGIKPAMSIDSWIQTADSNLYIGKQNGKNQLVG